MAFTGTPAEIAFKVILARVLARNELNGSSPYELFWAGTPASGWSFGPLQFDVAGNTTARDLLADILLNAVGASGGYIADDGNPNTGRGTVGNIQDTVVSALLQHASVTGGGGLSAAERSLINTALASAYGVNAIDSAVDAGLTDLMAFASRTTTQFARPADRPFLESDLGKLFLCDFANQYGTAARGQLQSFVQGNAVNGVSIEGALGVDDLLNFYLRTPNNRVRPWDGIRRFSGIVVETGYVPTDAAEARNVFRAATFHIHAPGNLDLIRASNQGALNEFVARVLEPARAVLLAALRADYTLPAGVFGAGYDSLSIRIDPALPGANPNHAATLDARSFSGQVEVGNDDLLIGEGGRDTLIGGLGNDILIGGTGDDTLQGGFGNDLYVFSGSTGVSLVGDGQDTIRDSDGIGSIRVGGTLLSGVDTTSIIHRVFSDRPAWQWTVNGRTFDFVLIDGDLQTGGTLWIEGDAVGLGDLITIENFHQGDLGLFFPVNPLLQFLPGTPGIQGPFADANFEPTTLSTTLREGEGRTLTLAFNTPARAGQAVRLSVDQLGNELAIVTGSQALSLGDGYVDLTLSEGQTQLTFTLLSQGNVNIDASLELTAALLDAQGNVQGSPADAAIVFDAIDEGSSPTAFPNFRFGTEGDDNFHNSTTTEYIEGAPLQVQTYGGNDLVLYDLRGRPPAAAVFDVGDGHDELNLANAQNWVNGGAGSDLLWVWGDNVITGGAGSDVIFTSDFEIGVPTGDRVYGDQEIELSLAIEQGETAEGSGAVGDLLSSPGEAAADLLVGTAARDVLAGGGGTDTLVSGAGDDLVLGDHYIYIEWAMTVWDWPTFQWDWHTNATPGPGGATVYSYELTNYVEYGWSDGNGNPLSSTGNLHEAILPGAADTIYAGAGNDLVLADDGDDFVDAGSGDDVVFGGIGSDTLLGDAGNDVLDGGDADDIAGADFIDGGDGNDKVWGGNGADALYGGSGADEIVGDDGGELGGNDYLNGEEGDDDLFGGARNDRLIGGEGADTAYGDSSADAIELQGDDYLDGGAGDDTLVGGGGDDHVVGGGESDHLYGDSGGTPNEATGDDYLDGGAGDDTLVGGGGSDILFGGDGADTIDGDEGGVPAAFHGDDRLDGGDGNDVLIGSGGSDTLFGGAGNDQLFGDVTGIAAADMGDDYLSGGIGDDTLSGYGGNDALDGDDGVDVLAGGDGDDELNGGEGNDSLVGDAGNDVLCGGAGVDVMNGGAGNDIYVFDAADLQVQGTTADGIIDTAGSNVVIFNDLASSSFTLLQGAQSGSINFVADGGALGLVVRGALAGSVATFQFADTTMSSAELIGRLYDANADQTSDAAGAMLIGGSRADTISGYGDGTTVSGGLGNDLLVGGDGSTTYRFERGDGVGTVTDASTFTATGGLNRNVLELGQTIASTDVSLALNAGSTQLRVDLGSGDALQLTQAIVPGDVINGPRTLDEIRFAEGTAYTWQEFLATRRIVITNTDNQASYQGTNSNDEIRGAELAETIDAGTGDDILAASGGNDTLIGGAGSDTYVFARGTGADAIVNTGADANSIDRLLIDPEVARGEVNFYRIADSLLVRIGTTSDQVFVSDFFGSAGLDQIAFADGTIYTAADVPLQTLPQNQLTYSRGEGNRTFVINDPSDSIFDRLQFGANVDPQSVVVGSDFQGNLVISFRNANGSFDESDTVVVTGGVTNAAARLNQVTFAADATIVWSDAEIRRRSTLPTEDGDYIYGTSGADTFEGLDGRDTIYGYAGDDVLDGGSYGDWLYGGDGNDLLIGDDSSDELRGETGNDVLVAESGEGTLLGGAGSDTYVVGRGVGNPLQLILNDFDIAAESIDVLKFAAGIAPGDIRFVRSGNNLRIDVVDRTRLNNEINNQVTITNYFSNTNRVIDEVRFTDDPAVVWRLADIQALALVGDGFNDILDGTTSAEILRGNGGDDLLNALGGNDDLDGGTGRDQLNGGDGDDVYRFGPGAGSDEVFDTSGTDRIELAAGIAPVDVSLFRVSSRGVIGATLPSLSDALVIHVNGTREQLLIENFFAADASARIEEIRFSDGTVWDSAAIAALVVDQSGIQNTQTGGSTDDAFAVDHSGDTIVEASGGGTDTVSASVSYVLPANVENLTLLGPLNLGGTGNVLSNTIIGTSGDNVLNGASGADTLIGGAGDDIYYVDQVGTSSWSSNYFNFQDTVVEQADDGSDTIIATTYSATLPANIERLILGFTLTGASSFPNGADLSQRFTGNALDNYIDASVASPYFGAPVMIDGGAGADVMIGNARANVYVIDNPGDVIVESWGGNDDRVESYIDYTLDERIENLTLLGSGSLSGTGNALRNVIIGNTAANVLNGADGNDTLNGGVGADTLIGGRGDDLYTVDNTGDIVLEGADEGSDTIESSISYTLGSNVERLLLAGAGWVGATGNELDNFIGGNDGNNILDGRGGNDQLNGGSGQDRYVGVGLSSGADTIFDFLGYDTLELDPGIRIDQLQFSMSGNDLRIELAPNSSVTIESWISPDFQVDALITTIDGLSYTYVSAQMDARAQGIDSAPVASAGVPDQSIMAGEALSFQFAANVFTDIESQQSLVYSADLIDGSALPSWLSFDATTRTFSGLPGNAEIGGLTVRVTATDSGGLSASTQFAVNVTRKIINGTAAADLLIGDAGDEIINGLPGDDSLQGLAGADELYGNEGDDTLDGGSGSDLMSGGSGKTSTSWMTRGIGLSKIPSMASTRCAQASRIRSPPAPTLRI